MNKTTQSLKKSIRKVERRRRQAIVRLKDKKGQDQRHEKIYIAPL